MARNKNSTPTTARELLGGIQNDAAQIQYNSGLDHWSRNTGSLRQQQTDFNNYLNSGNYSLDNNKKYRDMATQAVADLDTEMKRYGTSSNEYKTLKGYKTYYENALPTFDRLDVGANVQDYLSYDQDGRYTNWHTEDDYNTQKSYLDGKKQEIQSQMDALDDQNSAEYQDLASWRDQLDRFSEALDHRNAYDRNFKDLDEYTAYERSADYKNSVQAIQQRDQLQDQLKEAEADYKRLQMKYQFVTDLGSLSPEEAQDYDRMIQRQQEIERIKPDLEAINKDINGMEYFQAEDALSNIAREYGPDVNLEELVGKLKEDREKAEKLGGKYSEDYAKIDLQIRALAGPNENGTNENGLYDEQIPLGRYTMSNFDVENAEAEIERIDKELAELGATPDTVTGRLIDKFGFLGAVGAGMNHNQFGVNTAKDVGEAAALENDPRVMELRAEKASWQQKINSSDRLKGRNHIDGSYAGLEDKDALAERGAGLILTDNKGPLGHSTYQKPDAEAGENGDLGRYFSYLTDGNDDPLKGTVYAQKATDIRNKLYAAIAAENEGRDIGYTVDDVLNAYAGDMSMIAALKDSEKYKGEGSVGRFLSQEAFMLGGAAWNNIATMGDLFREDVREANRLENMHGLIREDMGEHYDNLNLPGGANLAQTVADATWTTGNMLPSILASSLLTGGLGKLGVATKTAQTAGKVLGAGMIGLSSGGQSYQQALREGWNKDDARLYGTILGAAEVGTQYLIGGIGKLGGVSEDVLLNAAKGIDKAAVRLITETGIHIGSEVAEELVQNRIERYLQYDLFRQGNADWYSWNDDDWYTVLVTAISTGAMEGAPGAIGAIRSTKLGNQLTGNAIPGKAVLKRNQANNELITEIGKAMQGDEALYETLTTIGTELMEEGSPAYELAEQMKSGKAARSAWNYGSLYSEILSEYRAKSGKSGVADGMAAVIGGAIKYHELKRAEDTVSQAKEQAAQVRRENPGAEVLEANASALATMGVGNAAQATEYGALANKVLSGTSLSDAEMQKLLGDSTAAKATRVLLSRQSSNPEALRELNLSLTRGNTEAAKAAINSQIEEVRAAKQLQRQANIEAVAQAAAEAADRSAVSAAAANAERSPAAVAQGQERVVASTVKAVQKADTELEAATRRLEQLKKMSFKELANSKLLGEGGAEVLVNAATDQDMRQQMATLQDRAEKLSAVRFPSQAQRTELADIREQQAALKEQIVANAESVRSQLEARASANASRGSANVAQGSVNAAPAANTAAAPAEAAQNSSADTIIIPGTGARMSREGFVQNYMAQNPGVTLEQANARFDQYAEQTGAVTKGNAENGQTADQDQERNDVGERGDRAEDQGRNNQSEQAAERSGADEFEELRTDGSRPEDAPAARVTKGASRVTDDNIEVITDDYADLPDLTASLKRSGFNKITYILDGDLVNDLGDSVAAVYNNGELFLRLDYPQTGYDYVGTAEHERLHLKLELMRAKFGDEDGKAFVSTTLQSLLGREAFTKAFDAYAKAYGPVYLASGLSVDEVAHMICEEMLCDMVGGINNFGTDLGDYLEDAEGILEASKFNVVMQNLVDNPAGDPGTVVMEEIDKNALPYGIPADTLISSENVDNPSTQPADASSVSKYAFFGLAEALGFKVDQTGSKNKVYYLNDEDAKLGRNGFTQITVDMIKQSPIGDLIRYSVDKGDITADEAKQQHNLFASIASITDQTHDFYQAMQFMGSTIFTALKANSDTQYGTTYDFPSICTKTQAIINEMSAQMVAKGRSLTEDEIIEAYNNVFNDGNPVPCPECYVFSRWVGIGGLLDNIRSYQDRFSKMTVDEVIAAYDEASKDVEAFAENSGLSQGRAKIAFAKQLDKELTNLKENIQKKENQGEQVPAADYKRLEDLQAEIPTIRTITWIDDVYFGGKAHKASNVNPNFAVPLEVLYDLNEGETFARDYKEAWAFRTTQGAGYGKAITPYAEAILGEGMLVTTNTTKSIKAKANGSLNNPYQTERGRITENSARGKNLKAARQKELNQLFIGGQRLQSTSDARFDNAVDYLLSALELQAMHSGAQVYTKVPGAVAFFNACKYCTNMSMMPKGGGLDANGTPVDTNVGGMDPTTMMMLRKRFEYAGSITIGVNDAHIRALMAQEFRDFIIPYHASGGKMTLIESFRQTQDPDLKGTTIRSSDYTKTQSDKILNDKVLRDSLGKSEKEIEDIHKFRETRLWILTGGKSGAYHSEILNPYEDGITEAQSNARKVLQGMYASMQQGGKWNGVKLAKGKVEHQIFPNEFWDVDSTYENSSVNTQRYLDYCDALGFLHRFSGKTVTYNRKTDKSEIVQVTGYDRNGEKVPLTDLAYKNGTDGEIEPFFWKTLTDRRMYGNNGQYLEQPNVDLTNLRAETVTTFAAPMGERRYNHRVSMTNAAARAANVSRNSIQSVEEVPAEAVTEEVSEGGRPIPRYSMRETDPETLKFLNDQLEKGEVVHAYKTFLELTDENGNVQLYPPMATKQSVGGKRQMANAMAIGEWEKSVGNPNSKNIFYDKEKKGWYYNLIKENGDSVPAAYDPYQHSSNVVLNDQFEAAWRRPNLVTYEVVVPQSEMTSGYHYEAERDDGQVVRAALPVGEHPWKKGTVADKLENTDRSVYMSRWLMPVRRLDNSEVARMYKEILDKEQYHVAIPFNVVPPGLQEELEKIGVPIDYAGSPQYRSYGQRYGADRFPAGRPIVEGVDPNAQPTKPMRPEKPKRKKSSKAKTSEKSRFSIQGQPATPQQAQARYSIQDEQSNNWAPEFYSKMANTINEWTNGKGQPLPPKMSAQQVLGWLKGKGVKSEEIKWSGIVPYLEGKKTVTKEELQQVMAENEIKIETKVLGREVVGEGSYYEGMDPRDGGDFEIGGIDAVMDYIDELAEDLGYEEGSLEPRPDPFDGWVHVVDTATGKEVTVIQYHPPEVNDQTRWSDYTTRGGDNYREILFKQPGLEYINDSMDVHWDGEQGVLAHARVQDMYDANGDQVLFVEEIQSDLHNAGTSRPGPENTRGLTREHSPSGFAEGERADFQRLLKKSQNDDLSTEEENQYRILARKYLGDAQNAYNEAMAKRRAVGSLEYRLEETVGNILMGIGYRQYTDAGLIQNWIRGERDNLLYDSNWRVEQLARAEVQNNLSQADEAQLAEVRAAFKAVKDAAEELTVANRNATNAPPDVPFAGSSDTYHEYVMKHLLRLAAEGDYDSVAWTTADMQSRRWSDQFAEGYRIEYDQKLPKFMNKYGKQWGARVEQTQLDTGDTVWSVKITPEMKESVLKTGQPLFSIQNDSTETTNPYPENTLQHDMLEAARNGTLSEWVTEQMNAHEDALENAKIRPPVIPSKGFVPKVTAQEKAALENRRKGLIQAKGAMKPNEKSNGFAMPRADETGNRFRRFLQNAGSAEELKVAQDQVEKFAFTDVAGTYVPDSNKADLNWAKNVISEDGLDSAVKQFNREAMKMEMPSNVTKSLALGQQLLIETSRQGDMQKFLDVLSSLTLLSSQAGKSLQAFRMLKQSGPIGELYYVQKAVGQLNDRNADKITAGRMSEITVPEDLANAVLMASTQEAQDKAMDELISGIAAQVPVTLMDKWNAWRYMAMLGNARTHVRNIIGNAVFVPLRFAKDLMAAGGEFLATKTGLMEEQDRRKAISVSRELRDFAKQDALAMQKELQGSGKYNPAREILDARKILPGFLETLSRKNGELLEYEDWLFLSPAYQGALSQALAHTGYSLSEMLDGSNKDAVRALNNARRIAIEEAQKATYRDFNAAASMLNRIKRMESGRTSDKVIGVLLEGILPFTKTPINILRRGVEYSPIGIASSIFEAAAKVKSGEFDAAEFIDHLSAGLSGTAVVVLGYLLASLGYIRNKKDDKEEEFDKLQGYQDYSLQIGKVSATIDWAAPTALPLFTGAAAYDMIQRDESLEWKDAWDAMMMIAEPMMSLSMLDGLNNVLSAASYADDSDKLATTMSSAFTSYIGQAFPTLLGQLARSIDGTRRSTYVDKNSPVPSAIQRFVQSSVQSKTPVWEEQKIPYIDQWGREDTVSSRFLGAMENFLSPSYVNIVHTTDVDETLRDLYDTTKDSGVLPSTAAKYFSVAGERKDLTADEYVSYAKDVGSTKYQLLTSLFADPRYMSLTDDQKAEAVSVIYKYATAAGKYHIDQNYDLHAQGKWIEEAEAAATDVQRFNRIWEYLEEHFKK